MAVDREFINVIVRIKAIERCWPGGFGAFRMQHRRMFGRCCWHDRYLFREGAMGGEDAAAIVAFWTAHGLVESRDFALDGSGADWLAPVPGSCCAVYDTAHEPGEVMGRDGEAGRVADERDSGAWLQAMARVGVLPARFAQVHGPLLAPKGTGFDPDRAAGMLQGVALGDALGNTSESLTPARRRAAHGEIRDYLPNWYAAGRAVGLPSDDTQLTFWTLDQMLADDGFVPESVALRLAYTDQIFGLGGSMRDYIRNLRGGRPWYACGTASAGNGALMRIAPLLLPHLRTGGTRLWSDVALAAATTHADPLAMASAVSFAGVLWELMDFGAPPEAGWWGRRYTDGARAMEGDAVYRPRGGIFPQEEDAAWRIVEQRLAWASSRDLSVAEACEAWHSGAYLLETLPCVLYILMRHAHEPEEAMVRAVNDTKDNDTIASLVGAALGALHGTRAFPRRWIDGLSGRTRFTDDGRVQTLIGKAVDQWCLDRPLCCDCR